MEWGEDVLLHVADRDRAHGGGRLRHHVLSEASREQEEEVLLVGANETNVRPLFRYLLLFF